MTRKHFIAIAKVLNDNRASLDLVEDMARELAKTNPNFDRGRFISASTVAARAAQQLEEA